MCFPPSSPPVSGSHKAASMSASNAQTAVAGRGWNGRSSRARWSQGLSLLAPTSRYFRAGETGPSLRRHQTPAELGSRPNGPGRGRKPKFASLSLTVACEQTVGRSRTCRAICCNWRKRAAKGGPGEGLQPAGPWFLGSRTVSNGHNGHRLGHAQREQCSAGRPHKGQWKLGRCAGLGGLRVSCREPGRVVYAQQ